MHAMCMCMQCVCACNVYDLYAMCMCMQCVCNVYDVYAMCMCMQCVYNYTVFYYYYPTHSQDIIDTGGTMMKLLDLLKQYEPANVKVAR